MKNSHFKDNGQRYDGDKSYEYIQHFRSWFYSSREIAAILTQYTGCPYNP
jgi:hypothetical protein